MTTVDDILAAQQAGRAAAIAEAAEVKARLDSLIATNEAQGARIAELLAQIAAGDLVTPEQRAAILEGQASLTSAIQNIFTPDPVPVPDTPA